MRIFYLALLAILTNGCVIRTIVPAGIPAGTYKGEVTIKAAAEGPSGNSDYYRAPAAQLVGEGRDPVPPGPPAPAAIVTPKSPGRMGSAVPSTPVGPAGGDLLGSTYPNPLAIGIHPAPTLVSPGADSTWTPQPCLPPTNPCTSGSATVILTPPIGIGVEAHFQVDRPLGTHYWSLGGYTGAAASDAAIYGGVGSDTSIVNLVIDRTQAGLSFFNGHTISALSLEDIAMIRTTARSTNNDSGTAQLTNWSFGSTGGDTSFYGNGVGVVNYAKATTNPSGSAGGSWVYADHTTGDLAFYPFGAVFPVVDIGPTIITNWSSTGNGVQTAELEVTTSTAVADTSQTFTVPVDTAGVFTVIITGKTPATASYINATWSGTLVNNGGACTVGGAFALVGSQTSNSTLSAGVISVSAVSCVVTVSVTGIAVTTVDWSSTAQYASGK